jgi:Lipopolysaccharide kinase (Kdo/WaaP) family
MNAGRAVEKQTESHHAVELPVELAAYAPWLLNPDTTPVPEVLHRLETNTLSQAQVLQAITDDLIQHNPFIQTLKALEKVWAQYESDAIDNITFCTATLSVLRKIWTEHTSVADLVPESHVGTGALASGDPLRVRMTLQRAFENKADIGRGAAGVVRFDRGLDGMSLCTKFAFTPEERMALGKARGIEPVPTLSLHDECTIQSQFYNLSKELQETAMETHAAQVGVPQPHFLFQYHDGARLRQCLSMQRIAGRDLQHCTQSGEKPYSGFNAEATFTALKDFLGQCHERGLHHRDIAARNVIIPAHAPSAGEPLIYLIDFGMALAQPDASAREVGYVADRTKNNALFKVRSDDDGLKEVYNALVALGSR